MSDHAIIALLSLALAVTVATCGAVIWIMTKIHDRIGRDEYKEEHAKLVHEVEELRNRIQYLHDWAIRLNGQVSVQYNPPNDHRPYPRGY